MIIISDQNMNNGSLKLDIDTFNSKKLSTLQRIIFSSDGTVTRLVEEIVKDNIVINKLYEGKVNDCFEKNFIQKKYDDYIQRRVVTLNGKNTKITYLHADSIVYHDNLMVGFSRDLKETKTPIGKVWEKHRVETYKTMVCWGFEKARDLHVYFNVPADSLMIYRTYNVYSNGNKVLKITERFPYSWFRTIEDPVSFDLEYFYKAN